MRSSLVVSNRTCILRRSSSSASAAVAHSSKSTASALGHCHWSTAQRRDQSSAPSAQQQQQSATISTSNLRSEINMDLIPKELRYYVEFDRNEQDLHFELLEEAHLKHGVFLNVPPQLPPEGSPPEVPEPLIGAATLARLASLTLAFEPTHAPPPFETCGTRGIDSILIQQEHVKPVKSPPMSSSRSAATTAQEKEVPAVAAAPPARKPIELEAKFHCSFCHKPFKGKIAGELHIKTAHDVSASAKLDAGPGEGELMSVPSLPSASQPDASTARAGEQKEKAVGSRLTAVAGEGAAEVKPKKTDYSLAELALPEENEIEEMLKEVWDAMGQKLQIKDFKESTAIVAGVADKRPPPGSEHLKPSFSATPAGVAPGIKKTISSKAALPMNEHGRIMTIKEMSARFTNPFGDSDLFADFEEDDNLNPFLPIETPSPTGAVASAATSEKKDVDGGIKSIGAARRLAGVGVSAAPTTTTAAPQQRSIDLSHCSNSLRLAKKLSCHICDKKFRLLDALQSHYEDDHDTVIPDELLRKALAISPTSALYEDKIPTARTEALTAASAIDASDNNGGADGEGGGADGEEGSLLDGGVPVPIEETDVAIHMRAQSNTVLLGDIVEVKRGFIKTHAVMQLIVRVSHNRSSGSSSIDNTPTDGAEDEAELITVRCYGDMFNAGSFVNEIRVGSQIMVNGSLRLNRRLDKVSNRVHAFPYVLVTSPLGCIQVVE